MKAFPTLNVLFPLWIFMNGDNIMINDHLRFFLLSIESDYLSLARTGTQRVDLNDTGRRIMKGRRSELYSVAVVRVRMGGIHVSKRKSIVLKSKIIISFITVSSRALSHMDNAPLFDGTPTLSLPLLVTPKMTVRGNHCWMPTCRRRRPEELLRTNPCFPLRQNI